jgi:hypothetical protein
MSSLASLPSFHVAPLSSLSGDVRDDARDGDVTKVGDVRETEEEKESRLG